MPAQDRVGAYQEEELAQLVHRKVVKQAGEDRPVGVGEGGFVDLALQDQQLVSECKDLDVFIVDAHRQQAPAAVVGLGVIFGSSRC